MARESMKFGILGHGSIGKRHAKNLEILGHEVGWYDPADGFSIRGDIINWADAIVVASPSQQHGPDLTEALDAEKHVFVEKPFGYDCPPYLEGYLKGNHMRAPHLIVAAGFNLRFHECVVKAKNYLDKIGPITGASFSVLQKSEKPEYLRDGVIRNWSCHEMDLASHLFGAKLQVVDCHAEHNWEGKDQTWCIIDMKHPDIPNMIRINADYTTEPQQRFFWIEGAGGTIYVNLLDRTMRVEWSDKSVNPYEFKGIGSFGRDYQVEMLHFAGSVKSGRHMEPMATGYDGVHNLYHIMKARELARVS
jgi:predicted dehydrogenase